jgi:hypothetical protein
MTRANDERVLVIGRYLAVLAAATIVLSMQAPPSQTTAMAIVEAARFVVAVLAVIFGAIAWCERRFPVDEGTLDLVEADVDLAPQRR